MRCTVCNVVLTDFEATRKHAITGEYLDTCNHCLDEIEIIPTLDREDLRDVIEVESELDVHKIESDCY